MAAALLLALAACGRGDRAAPAEHHDDHDDHDDHGAAAPHADGDHPAPPDRVEIAPEMRRDLRVTTARAEARPAGEQVAALGELQVNQDAYAEVAAPAPARVVKVLARAGDEVTLGPTGTNTTHASSTRCTAAKGTVTTVPPLAPSASATIADMPGRSTPSAFATSMRTGIVRDAVRLRVGSTGTATFAALPGRTIDGVVTLSLIHISEPTRPY